MYFVRVHQFASCAYINLHLIHVSIGEAIACIIPSICTTAIACHFSAAGYRATLGSGKHSLACGSTTRPSPVARLPDPRLWLDYQTLACGSTTRPLPLAHLPDPCRWLTYQTLAAGSPTRPLPLAHLPDPRRWLRMPKSCSRVVDVVNGFSSSPTVQA